jgi:putative hemolysin
VKPHLKVVLAVGALALCVAPAMALASPPVNQGTTHNHPPSSGPEYNTAPPPQAKAYGHYCNEQGASKKHVKGQKGTPFSQCVTALARAAHNPNLPTTQACKALSKKHVKGQKGTPFSQCVVAAAHMRRDEHQSQTS